MARIVDCAQRVLALAFVTASLLVACRPVGSPAAASAGLTQVDHEPAAASAFLQAYCRGDEASAEKLASPLYRQEWARRHVSAEDRAALLPQWYRTHAASTDWLDVSFVDGVTEADGTMHLLYVGRSTRAEADALPSIWRVDADAAGRVIWVEMVWLFSDPGIAVAPLSDVQTPETNGLPPALARLHPEAVVGVRATTGWEGYYAVRRVASGKESGGPAKSWLVFFAVDDTGRLRPGAWSYHPV